MDVWWNQNQNFVYYFSHGEGYPELHILGTGSWLGYWRGHEHGVSRVFFCVWNSIYAIQSYFQSLNCQIIDLNYQWWWRSIKSRELFWSHEQSEAIQRFLIGQILLLTQTLPIARSRTRCGNDYTWFKYEVKNQVGLGLEWETAWFKYDLKR